MTAITSSRRWRWDADAQPSIAGEARKAVTAVLEQWGLGDLTDDVALLASEILTNAYRHVRKRGPVTLTLRPCGCEGVTCEVADTDPVLWLTSPADDDEDAEGGRGLTILRAVAASSGVRWRRFRRGKVVFFTCERGTGS